MELSDYKSVIDSSPYGYVLYKVIPGDERSHEFQCIAANIAFETITGFKSSDMIGKMHRQIFPDWKNQDEIFFKLVEKRGRKKFDLMTRDGKRRVTVTAYPMADDMIVTCLSESSSNHRSDKKLTESRKDYDVFYDLSKNLLCVFDMEGRLTRYNRAWAKRLGYPADDYIGKKYLDYVHPDDRGSIEGVFGMMRSSERLKNFTCRLKDSKGDYKTFEWHAQIIDQHIFAIAQDITDQIHTHSRQWESSEKFRLIFENSPLGFMHYTPEGVITACNDNFVNIIGSSRKQLVGLNMFVLPDERLKATLEESIKGKETTQIEIVYKSFTAKKETPVRIVFVPVLSETGETMGGIGIIEDITERLNAARELMDSKEKYQMLFEEAADGVMIGVEGGTIIDANKAMTGVSGYEEHELVGRNVTMLFSDETLKEKPLDYKSLLAGKTILNERKLKRKDHREMVVEMKTKVLGDGRLISYFRDITQRKLAEEALRVSEERLKRFFELNPYAILIASPDGYPIRTNQAFVDLFGGEPSKQYNIFKDPVAVRLGIIGEMKKALAGETVRIPDFSYHSTGPALREAKDLWIRMVVFPLSRIQDNVEMLILMYEDMTEHYLLREKLRHSEKMEAIGQLTGGIAHDFNNMLSGIMGGATLLERSVQTDDARRYLKMITDSAERMADLTRKLLVFGRMDDSEFKRLNVHEAIVNAIEILKYAIDKKIKITSGFHNKPLLVKGNMSQLQNVFINLGINAGHAMPDGGELVFKTSETVLDGNFLKKSSEPLAPGHYVKIEISDTGKGIPSALKSKVFEPFFSTKKRHERAGMGLSMVYGSVKDHGGMIDFSSAEGTGTVFTILLPMTQEKPVEPALYEDTVQDGSGLVLLVDDESIVRDTTKDMIEALGYNVITADNGRDGVDKYVGESRKIDVVLLDMVMPEMNGKECFRELIRINPSARIVLYSGFLDMADVDELKKEGLRAYLKKPFTLSELSHILKS